jgi:hypothetical protein
MKLRSLFLLALLLSATCKSYIVPLSFFHSFLPSSSFLPVSVSPVAFVKAQDEDDDVEVVEETDAMPEATEGDIKTPEGAEVEAEEEDWIIRSHKDFKFGAFFPSSPEKKFPVGTRTTVLLGVHNTGKNPFNISYVYASLHSPFDYSYYIQNVRFPRLVFPFLCSFSSFCFACFAFFSLLAQFTVRQYFAVVNPGEQITIDYTFIPDKSLEPLDFWLSAHVIYNDTVAEDMFLTTFFNGTVELVEKPTEFNFRRFVAAFFSCWRFRS